MEQIKKATDYIRSKTEQQPQLGIILGTGLGNLVNDIDITFELDYKEIPGFPLSTVESHSGKLIFGELQGKSIVAMQGRFHYYEGYTMQEVVFPVRVLKFLGIERLFISNASGGLSAEMEKGDLMIIRDHINLLPSNPFIGENEPELGPRFPDLCEPYDNVLIDKGIEIAKENNFRCHKGVYICVPGPVLETKAEYNYLHDIGGDAVGMSTVPEVMAACQMGVPVFAISVVTDVGYPIERVQKLTIEDVIAVAGEAEPKLTTVLKQLIGSI